MARGKPSEDENLINFLECICEGRKRCYWDEDEKDKEDEVRQETEPEDRCSSRKRVSRN
jgi:hypothetical protein